MPTIDDDLNELVDKLRKFKPGQPLERFITHIRFPRFKNLRPGARVNFDFPITALVGSNGCGKTSVLHALYGAPERQSTSDFWFSTTVDPIEERNDDPHRFIYGHWLKDKQFYPSGGIVETRKARVKKEGNPEYWEPTKVTSGDAMTPMPLVPPDAQFGGPKARVRSLDRWSAVKREVLYLNFRGELGAFDQFFWFGQLKRDAVHTKQDVLRRQAPYLSRVIESGSSTLVRYGREHVFSNVAVSQADLDTASSILEKSYDGARRIEHDLYGGLRGFSAVFNIPGFAYSEAFAGSGEIAVLNLVARIRAQPRFTLILLDEPEVSLHPGAQKRLLKFLLEECKRNHHQVVFTTHSPYLVESLPSNAIKVFTADSAGVFDVINETHPYAAFHRLGATPPGKVKVLVEDRLAKHVVELALNQLPEGERASFDVDFLPGGASTYKTHRIPTIMTEKQTWLLLDGDQHRATCTPSASVAPNKLAEVIEQVTGVPVASIVFGADGGDDEKSTSKQRLLAEYLNFFYSRVRFLPRCCPEEIVLRAVNPDAAPPKDSQAAKAQLRDYIEALGLSPSSSDSDAQSQLLLAQKSQGNADLAEVAKLLRQMLPKS